MYLWNADTIKIKDMPAPRGDYDTHSNTAEVAKMLIENLPGTCYDEICNAIEEKIRQLADGGYAHLLTDRFFVAGHVRGVLQDLAYPN